MSLCLPSKYHCQFTVLSLGILEKIDGFEQDKKDWCPSKIGLEAKESNNHKL